DGAVPSPYCAVVGAQLVQLGGLARLQRLDRILLGEFGQQTGKVPYVLLEQVTYGVDPAFPEPHPRTDSLVLQFRRPRVGGLLEQWNARFVPECLAEQER